MQRLLLGALMPAVLAVIGAGACFTHDLGAARARLTGRSQILVSAFGTIEYA